MWISATSNVHPIEGSAHGLEGFVEVTLDDGRPNVGNSPEAEVTLQVADLSSGNSAYDTEMRRRLEIRKYPSISGKLTDAKEATDPGRYRVDGELTFHGVTRMVATDMTVRIDGDTLHAEWEQAIDIRDFELSPPRILMFKVNPEVGVRVQVIAQRHRMEER